MSEYEDPIYSDAKLFALSRDNVSPASLQRNFLIGYNRAARLIEAMEKEGVISAADHAGRRTVIKRIVKMTDLPCCRLCECVPTDSQTVTVLVTCSKSDCPCSEAWFTEAQWRKLMYVPEKIAYDRVGDELFRRRNEGYNAAIDDMLRGGE